MNLDRGYDSRVTDQKLRDRQYRGAIARHGGPPPAIRAGMRWVVERLNSWQNAFKKLVLCTERRQRVVDFYVAFANAIIIVRRLVREGWKRYRWEGRPARCP